MPRKNKDDSNDGRAGVHERLEITQEQELSVLLEIKANSLLWWRDLVRDRVGKGLCVAEDSYTKACAAIEKQTGGSVNEIDTQLTWAPFEPDPDVTNNAD